MAYGFFYFVNSFFFLNFYAYCPSFFNFIFRSFRQSLNGDCWRGLFSPPKPIAQMAVGGEGPFLFNSFRLCPLFFSILFGYAHFLNLFFGDALFLCFLFFVAFFFFRPCKPVAQMRLVVRGPLLSSSANNFPACNGCVKKNKQKQHTSAFCVYERVGGPSLGTQNAGVYLRGSY